MQLHCAETDLQQNLITAGQEINNQQQTIFDLAYTSLNFQLLLLGRGQVNTFLNWCLSDPQNHIDFNDFDADPFLTFALAKTSTENN